MGPFFTYDVRYILAHLPDFGVATGVTLSLAGCATPIGMLIGIPLVLGRISKSRLAYVLSSAYIEFYRNTPLLVQIYFLFFALPSIGITLSPFVAGVVALSSQHASHFAEIYRGAIQSVGVGQKDAARALGMRNWQVMRLIILPQAFRDAIPPIGNEVILLILDTALVSTVGVIEIVEQANILGERSAATFMIYVFAAILYLVLTSLISGALRAIEHKRRIVR